MSEIRFSKEHEWLCTSDGVATIGISDYAQKQLGDIVYVELPDIGKQISQGEQGAVVESVKAASEIYAPVGGEVVEVNGRLEDDPSLVNSDPTGKGWFFKLKIANEIELETLMSEITYLEYIEGLG